MTDERRKKERKGDAEATKKLMMTCLNFQVVGCINMYQYYLLATHMTCMVHPYIRHCEASVHTQGGRSGVRTTTTVEDPWHASCHDNVAAADVCCPNHDMTYMTHNIHHILDYSDRVMNGSTLEEPQRKTRVLGDR